jgi:hypothetical protein
MARLNEAKLTITVSTLQRNDEDDIELLPDQTLLDLTAIISEMTGPNVMVEIEKQTGDW